MKIWDSLQDSLSGFKQLHPAELKKLAGRRLSDVVRSEAERAKERVSDVDQRYPSAGPREKAQRLIDGKKGIAGVAGGISGIFGLVSLPADLLVMTYLQIALLVDVATVYKVNLKAERARADLLDLFGYANGLGPIERAGPKVLGKVAGTLLEKGGLHTVGRALPLVAAPITAYLNNQHIQAVGEEGIRYYEGFDKAHAKTRKASGS